jgi:hypothetical protein
MAIGLFVAGRDSARADRFVTASKVHPIKVGFYFSFTFCRYRPVPVIPYDIHFQRGRSARGFVISFLISRADGRLTTARTAQRVMRKSGAEN